MSGVLYGVGLGPGDPDLMTLKAHRLILGARVVAYPSLAGDPMEPDQTMRGFRAIAPGLPRCLPVSSEVPGQARDTERSWR